MVQASSPATTRSSLPLIHDGVAFFTLSISFSVTATSLIASKLIYHRKAMCARIPGHENGFSPVITLFVESAAMYTISGLVFIALFARNSPIQFPFAALFGTVTVTKCANYPTSFCLLT